MKVSHRAGRGWIPGGGGCKKKGWEGGKGRKADERLRTWDRQEGRVFHAEGRGRGGIRGLER